MFKRFKKHFIPHEGNDHQPHFLRIKNIRTLILIVFIMELAVLSLPFLPRLNIINNNFIASVLPAVLDDLTNQKRLNQNLPILSVSPALNKVAELKAKDMAEKGYFAHTSPEGKAPWYWFDLVGYKYEYAGENLAINFIDSEDVTNAWMNSPTHKANIVKNSYTEMGTGIATGMYNGNSTIFVAQVFGKPAIASVVTVAPQVVSNTNTESKTIVSSKVKGASIEEVAKAEPVLVVTPTPVIGAEVSDVKLPQTYSKANIFQKYLASPRHIANIVLVILAVLIIFALLLKLFIRMDKKHPVLITNGMVVLVLIFGVYTLNNYLAENKTALNTSFMSFQEGKQEMER